MHWGRALREARQRAGLTQSELARRVGRTQSEVARFERRSDLLASTVRELVVAMGAEWSDLEARPAEQEHE